MAKLWHYAKRYSLRFSWGICMLLLTNAAALAIPQLFRFAVDGLRENAPVADLRQVALLLVLVAIGGAVFRTLSRIHLFYAARDVELDVRCAFYAHLTRLPPSFFATHPTGDLMSRATNDLPQIRLLLGPGLLNTVNTIVAYLGAVPLMMLISPKLTLIALAIYPPALVLLRWLGKQMFLRIKEQQQSIGHITNFVQENLAGSHVVRAFAIEAEQEQAFANLNADYYDKNLRLAKVRSAMFPLVIALAGISIMLAVYFGARDVLYGSLTLGELVALIEYMALLSWPTFAMGWVLSLWQRGSAAMTRMDEILSTRATISPGSTVSQALAPTLSISDLTVAYGDKTVLHSISLDVPAGTTLGIVGPIGSGKTALIRVIMRLLETEGGHVHIDGRDIKELDFESLRSIFGYVPQNPGLFSKTVAENVAFGVPHATRDEILAALAAASFSKDLDVLPQHLDTPVGERGLMLSGGQKQRVAIARALLVDPGILILDDSLSAVDSETEANILKSIRKWRTGRTTLIVSHRISAVQHANAIIVLDNGHIVERGTHDELLAHGALYASMARRQELAKKVNVTSRELEA